MLRPVLSMIIAVSLTGVIGVSHAYADGKADKANALTEKVKEGVLKLGTGEAARVEVKLRNKTKLKGYIREAGVESFIVMDPMTGVATTVAYPQVKQIKGNNLSKGQKIVIGIGVTLGALLVIWLIGATRD